MRWLCDTALIWSGTYGLSVILKKLPSLITIMTYGGVAFLIWYGIKALRRALAPATLVESEGQSQGMASVLATCAAFTLLNPHVYLDTVILVGSIANARPEGEQAAFATGASLASFVWFFAIGYGAAYLRPWLSQPKVWRGIDLVIAAIMFVLAATLLFG